MSNVYVDPGDTVTVHFKCTRCEDYRWRSVNPARNIRRALGHIDKGDLDTARERLATALEDLEYMAQWRDEAPASGESQEQ